jgi:hypothetical protein
MNAEQELRRLVRGRGVRAGDAHHSIGPALAALAGVAQSDTPVQVNRKLVVVLTEAAGRLPEDLRVAVLTALGLHGPSEKPFLRDRLSWLSQETGASERTTRRRATTALRLLGEHLDDAVKDPTVQRGWYTSSLRALLRLDVDPPQVVEDRVIVATADNLAEIELRFSAPVASGQQAQPIEAAILYGGEVTRTERVTPSHRKFTVRLPAPLRAGERHEYGVRFTAFPRAKMPPFYVFTPLQPCDRFTMRVRFGSEVPDRIWRLDGIPPRAIDDYEPAGGLLAADRLGEIALEFAQLHQGLSYGIRWFTDTGPRDGAESH